MGTQTPAKRAAVGERREGRRGRGWERWHAERRRTAVSPLPPGEFVEYRKNAHRLAGDHLVFCAVVKVMRRVWQVWKMRRTIPAADEVALRIGPVVTVGDYLNGVVGECCTYSANSNSLSSERTARTRK